MKRGPRWQPDEDEYLRDAYGRGQTDHYMAFMLGRPEASVYYRRIKLRLCQERGPRKKREEPNA